MEALQRSVEQSRKGREQPSADPAQVKRLPAGGKKNDKKKAAQRGQDQLAQLSKEELYEQASKRDITGRSKMNKDQLVKALGKAAS
ncbi:hypothetical protein ACLGIH_34020 [Streptomyces sp. HMX87]|uniref:hypothetical protein n=1 Tax=Streptomyces sp. HMX87 TaxID=3390849 RepID=UPI003A857FFC